MAAIQQVVGAVPIINRNPPPEGNMAAQLSFTLTPTAPNAATALQLSSQAGLLMSQVLTLVIDNTANAYPVTVVHGALNETVQIPAGSTSIVPTFSSAGNYSINVSASNGIFPSVNLVVNVIFLNYNRSPGTFNSAAQSNNIGSFQNSQTIISVFPSATGTGLINLVGPGNYVVDALDICVDAVEATAAGLWALAWRLVTVSGLAVNGVVASGNPIGTATAGGWINNPSQAVNLTWPNGLLCQRASGFQIDITAFSNLTSAAFRVNISGYVTP